MEAGLALRRRRSRGETCRRKEEIATLRKESNHKMGEVDRDRRLLEFHQLAEWRRDNEFIQSRYRPELRSHRKCFRSILTVHNETGNIWSHMLGCFIFLGLALVFFVDHTSSSRQKLVFSSFFTGAVLCLALSTIFHTVMCHSQDVNKFYNKLDYVGISLLTIGSYVPWTYYGFYCHTTFQAVYIGVICVLSALTIILTLADRFATPVFRPIRAILFVTLGCFGFVPAAHFIIAWGWQRALKELQIVYMGSGGASYIFGAFLYGIRVPERLFPGRCDLWGQSHQIFHVLVVAGALAHLKGLSVMADYRLQEGACM